MAHIFAENLSILFPLSRTRLKRKFISRGGTVGGDIVYINKTPHIAALKNVNLTCNPGDNVALIGPNGSGKTTLLRTLARIYEPTGGQVACEGTIATLFSSSVSLSDLETGRENIYYASVLRGISNQYLSAQLNNIIEICELGDSIDLPVSMYSEGMKSRLGFAMALIANPDIMLIDEVITTSDIHYLQRVAAQSNFFKNPNGITVIASHATDILDLYCNKALWLDSGEVKAFGLYEDVVAEYKTAQTAQVGDDIN